ncbi:transcriptional regulator [Actinosynnema sp. NPDC051121]
MPSTTLFSVLGPVEARAADGSVIDVRARKPITVLAVLLAHANSWVSAEELIAATWPEQAAPASANANLKTYVWQLRKALPQRRVEHAAGRYRLRVEPGDLDVDEVERLAETARQAVADGDRRTAATVLSDALGRWRGRPFGGLDVDATVTARLDALRAELRVLLAETFGELGELQRAVALWRALVEEDPLAEGHWARWMAALSRAGRHGDALAVHERARAVLAAELGVEPGPELAAARRTALAGTRPCRRDLPRAVPDFTGRDREVRRLESCRGVAVIDGMAGVGKSALAVHVAHRLAPRYPDGALYVNLREGGDVLAHLLRAIGASVPADPASRAAQWRAELSGRRVLLVLDDAVSAREVRPFLPGGPGCLVLVTTRVRRPIVDGADTITLGPLPPEEAADAFGAICGDWRAAAEPGAVAEVARLCEGLPAALRAAADRLRSRPMWTVGRLAARLADDGARIFELSAVTEPLAAACRELPPAARRLLAALAAEPDLTAAARLAGIGEPEAHHVAEDLLDLHLVVQLPADRYGLHPLIRDLVRVPAARPARVA